MRRLLITLTATTAVATGTLALGTSPASAGPATGNGSAGAGPVLRAEFKQNVDGSGYWYRTYGTSNCTGPRDDVDFGKSSMPENDWNDVVSYIRDYASCDVRIFRDTGFVDALTGYIDYGASGQSLSGSGLNNKTSSYRLS